MIQVVKRTFDILELLAQEEKPLGTTEIAEKMGISIQATNNLLRTLYGRGYVSQDESRNYRLGSQCFYLGSFADRWRHIRKRITDPLKQLVEESQLSGFVGVMENDRLLCIATMSPEDRSINHPPQSWWDELHSTACGRVLLSSLSAIERSKLFARTTRKKLTTSTIIDVDDLEEICARVTREGFSEVRDESREGASSLAVPLRDISGKVFAGLTLSSNNQQWETIPFQRKLQFLINTVEKLERT